MRSGGVAPEERLPILVHDQYAVLVMKMQLGTGETFLLFVLFLSAGHVGGAFTVTIQKLFYKWRV